MMPSPSGFGFHGTLQHQTELEAGRCHGSQITLCLKRRLNSSSFAFPFALAAIAIAQSGCR